MWYKMREEEGFETDLEYGKLIISGNEELGYRPFQLLVSAVAVCSGGVLRKVLTKKRISFEDIQIHAEVERNDAEAGRIEKIHLHFVVKGQLSETQLQKSLEVTRKNCSMVQSVKDSIEVTESYEII